MIKVACKLVVHHFALIAFAYLFASAAVAQTASCPVASSTILQPTPTGNQIDKTASALWLNASQIQWPGVDATSSTGSVGPRYFLLAAANSSIKIELGRTASGFNERLPLQIATNPLLPNVQQQFAYLEPGVRLLLNEFDQQKLPSLVTQQMVLIQEDTEGRVVRATEVQAAALLDTLFVKAETSPEPLGVQVDQSQTAFRLWAPTARAVSVCLQLQNGAKKNLPMQRDLATGIWSVRLNENLTGSLYTYAVDVHVNQLGLMRNRVTDPYSVSLNANSVASFVADLDASFLKPSGWDRSLRTTFSQRKKQVKHLTDMLIYELHVRDFSAADESLPSQLRGKYLAFTKSQAAGVRHLAALKKAGITDIHFLPFFDLATVPEIDCKQTLPSVSARSDLKTNPASELPQAEVHENKASDCFNWGYDPWHYTAPEGSFATNANDPARRVIELRQMIMALHQMGLRVGMDVVYNHTSAAGQAIQSVLDRIVPGYYQRLNSKGEIETSTCCANTATEHRMMSRLMRDSVVTWTKHYGIDSFRFDLMGHQPKDAMLRLQQEVNAAAGKPVQLIGEGWNFGEVANNRRFVQASQGNLNGSTIATFSDRARDAIRGGGCCDSGAASVESKGFVNRVYNKSVAPELSLQIAQQADLARVGLAGTVQNYVMPNYDGKQLPLSQVRYGDSPAGYASEPTEVVNYVENHDNQTLFDIHVFKLPVDTSAQDRARVQLLALAFPVLSQGVAYFHAGGELLRSKSLDRNSYDSGDWFNRIDWTGRTHAFPSGLPIKNDNGGDWGLMKAFLENPAIRVNSQEILWTRDNFLALLKIRSQTNLLRLPTTQLIKDRLKFHNTGPNAVPGLLVGDVNGQGLTDSRHQSLVYFINAQQQAVTIQINALRGRNLQLHPLLKEANSDERQKQVRFDKANGTVTIPARTVTVLVD